VLTPSNATRRRREKSGWSMRCAIQLTVSSSPPGARAAAQPHGSPGAREADGGRERERTAMDVHPTLQADGPRPRVERAVSSVVPGHGRVEVVGTIRVRELVGLLGIVAGSRQVMIEEVRSDLFAFDGFEGGKADADLAPSDVGREHDRSRGDLRLEDGRD